MFKSGRLLLMGIALIASGVVMAKNKILNPWISTVSIDSIRYHNDSMEQRFQRIDNWLAALAPDQPDLVLLPEACLTGLGRVNDPKAFIRRGDKYFTRFQRLAKRYNTYLAATVLFTDDNRRYNAVLLFAPTGKLEYIYHKSYLTPSELKAGLTPGKLSQKCWDAPWGKTAFAICYDLNFSKLFNIYKQQKAELLLFPSYFPGGMVLKQRAFFMRSFAVSSHGQGFESLFIDRAGREFARANMLEPAITRKVYLNSAVVRFEPGKFKAIKAKLGRKVKLETLRPEGFTIITIPESTIDIKTVIRDYRLSRLDDWYLECENSNNKKRQEVRANEQ